MGFFDGKSNVFTVYKVRLQMRDWIVGGIPKNPKMVEGWLRAAAGLTSDKEELRQVALRTMIESGIAAEDATYEEAVKASDEMALTKQAVGFKRDGNGLYLESRCVKAMLKENANVWFAGVLAKKFGASEQQGAKNYVAEHVFINPDRIYLGVAEPTGVHLFIGHTSGPKGNQSSLTYHEYVEKVALAFEVMISGDGLSEEDWSQLWPQAQEHGLGTLRSQGFGRFDVEDWERVIQGITTKNKAEQEREKAERRAQAEKEKIEKKALVLAKNGKVEPPAVPELAR